VARVLPSAVVPNFPGSIETYRLRIFLPRRPATTTSLKYRRFGAAQLTSDDAQTPSRCQPCVALPDRRPILENAEGRIERSEVTFKQRVFLAQGSLTAWRQWAQPLRLAAIAKPTLRTYMVPQHATSS
jgi:hypothetical protein